MGHLQFCGSVVGAIVYRKCDTVKPFFINPPDIPRPYGNEVSASAVSPDNPRP